MTYGEKRKTIIFNLDNEDERAMYELISKINFSKLVKKYLSAELQRMRAAQQSKSSTSSTSHQASTTQP